MRLGPRPVWFGRMLRPLSACGEGERVAPEEYFVLVDDMVPLVAAFGVGATGQAHPIGETRFVEQLPTGCFEVVIVAVGECSAAALCLMLWRPRNSIDQRSTQRPRSVATIEALEWRLCDGGRRRAPAAVAHTMLEEPMMDDAEFERAESDFGVRARSAGRGSCLELAGEVHGVGRSCGDRVAAVGRPAGQVGV